MRVVVSNEYIIHDDFAELIISGGKYGTKTILLNVEDVEKCKMVKWYINMYGHKRDITYIVSSTNLLIHRHIMDVHNEMCVDHINGDTLDNRKSNLRLVTKHQNSMNRKYDTTYSSGHKGVIWYPYRGVNKWVAYIKVDGTFKNLGYFDDIEEAIKVRKVADENYFGEYARK